MVLVWTFGVAGCSGCGLDSVADLRIVTYARVLGQDLARLKSIKKPLHAEKQSVDG